MKFFDRKQIEELSKFKSGNYLITSFYLSTDKSSATKKQIVLSLKNLISDGRARSEALNVSREKKDSLLEDLEEINLSVSQSIGSINFPGLAVFSSSGEKIWKTFNLSHAPRNRIIIDRNPYVRPLSAILDRFKRICAFLVGRREARWYEVFMEEIKLLDSLTSDVPSKVREGGWEGYESKRIERHVEAHLQEHFKKAAQQTFALFKKDQFDWLFLGCEDNHFSDMESHLHTYLKERLKGRLKAKPGDSPDKILKEATELEMKLKKEEDEELVRKLVSELERGGLGVAGIKETLRHLNQTDVQTLFVTHNFSKEGKICPSCRFLYLEESVCPSCQKKTEPVLDVIDEAIEAAMNKNCQVRHITPPSKLDRFGKIGAFLRYKI